MQFSIYVIRNKINNKHYVGQTRHEPLDRIYRHIDDSMHNRGYAFHSAIRRHGLENFEIIKIIHCDPEEANFYEGWYSGQYDSMQPNGYNILTFDKMSGISEGFWKGKNRSEETKKKISETKLLNPPIGELNPFYGKTHSEETKQILSEKAKIQYNAMPFNEFKKTPAEQSKITKEYWASLTEEQKSEICRNISEGRKGIPRTPEMNKAHSERMTGRTASDETKFKMSQAHTGVSKSLETRLNMKIAQQNRVSQETRDRIIKIDEMLKNNISVKEIATQTGVTPEYIYKIKNRHNVKVNKKRGTTDPYEASERLSKILQMLEEGTPGADIARACNCSKTYVSTISKKYGFSKQVPRAQEFRDKISAAQRIDKDTELKFKELVESGVRLTYAIEQLGIDRTTGYRIAKRLNIDLKALKEKFKNTGRTIRPRTKNSL